MEHFAQVIFNNNLSNLDRTAIVDNNGTRSTSWGELYEMSKKVSMYVRDKKLTGVVPIWMERNTETIATVLGFNLAGIGTSVINTNIPLKRRLNIEQQTENNSFTINDFQNAMEYDTENYSTALSFPETALVFFTSGSTGNPKGVMHKDEAIISAMKRVSGKAFFDYGLSDVVVSFANFSFALILDDIFSPLFSGSTVHIVPDDIKRDANLVTEYINRHSATKFTCAPQMLRNIGTIPTVKLVATGTDKVSNIGPKGYKLLNIYGQSETIGICSSYVINSPMDNTPIGKISSDFAYYILDNENNEVEEGELCLSGKIASGYYKQDKLTKEIFINNPFKTKDGYDVLLHTGDVVRRLPDNNLLFLYRKDSMLKINGQRVEPGESEVLIKKYDGIRDVVVKAFINKAKSYMCAFYTSDSAINSDNIKEYLSDYLPQYAIPTYFVHLDSFPINENGKIDRAALKLPEHYTNGLEKYIAPSNDVEEKLCKAFSQVLKLERIGVNDDFIRLGGDSISAMDVVQLAHIKGLKVTDILSARTPAEIYNRLSLMPDYENLTVNNISDKTQLTDSQMGIYLQCIQSPLSTMYNIPLYFSIDNKEKYSSEYLKSAVDRVLSLHPALYSHIDTSEDKIYMIRNKFPPLGICNFIDSDVSFDDIVKTFIKPFDLSVSPLCRLSIYIQDTRVYIFMDIHHIVSDGTSCKILCRDICNSIAGKEINPEEIDSFSLFSIESRQKNTVLYKNARDYFNNIFAGIEVDSSILPDNKEKNEEIHKVSAIRKKIKLNNLSSFLHKNFLTENSFFMGVFGYALGKFTYQSESMFSIAENGRKNPLLSNTVSMMVRTVPIHATFNENDTAVPYLLDLQNQTIKSIDNDIYSYLDFSNDIGINSDIMFVYQSDMLSTIRTELGEIKLNSIQVDDAFSKFNLSVFKTGDDFELVFQYRNDIYNEITIERFSELYISAANGFIQNIPLSTIGLTSEKDIQTLDSFNNYELEYDVNSTFLDKFYVNVKNNGEKLALSYKDNKYSYSQIDFISDCIAKRLNEMGVRENDVVPVLIQRNEYMVIASIGILKCGAAYQPLDPTYPSERLNFMCCESEAKVIIADRNLKYLLNEYCNEFLYLDEIEKLTDNNFENRKINPKDPFVLLYSSGTTGTPKGSILTHGNISALMCAYSAYNNLDENSVSAQFASYGFDSHLTEIYPILYNCGSIFIIPDDIRLDLTSVKEFCDNNSVTILFMTTQVARQFATEIDFVKSLKIVITGGETLSPFEPNYNYVLKNCYGPSECTVITTGFNVDKYYDNIPIGKALANNKLYVIDTYGRRLPVGVPGELVISGPQVGAGYYKRPDLTKRAFITNTFDNSGNLFKRCYKTGDIVRFDNEGNLLFIGRRDSQVKIRGFRIELSEVEGIIRAYPGISDATVIAKTTPNGKEINAYIVSDSKIDISDLNNFIKSKKPSYMVPAATMQIDSIPLTPNMKVDKRKLPEIIKTSISANNNRSVLTDLETRLLEIVNVVTGNKSSDIYSELTDLGLTSITSIKLSVEIYKIFGIKVTSKDLLNNCSIIILENKIVNSLLSNRNVKDSSVKVQMASYPLTQTQMGIYLDCMSIGTDAYNIPALFKLPKDIDITKLKSAIVKAISAHKSMLCYIYPNANGDVAIYPKPDMSIEIIDSYESLIPPEQTHFEFKDTPLFKFRIINCDNDKYLFIEIHHIIADGESMGILIDDIDKAYSGLNVQSESYTAYDLSLDEQVLRNGDQYHDAKEYYRSVFKGLSSDYKPAIDLNNEDSFSNYDLNINANVSVLKDYCIRLGVSESVFFTGIFAVTLAKFTSHDDALFTSIHNGRDDPRTANLVSMLVKTFPIYTPISKFDSIISFYKNLDEKIKLLKKYDVYSFVDAVHEFNLNADIMFIYQGKIGSGFKINGQNLECISAEFSKAKSELSVEVYEDDDNFRIHIEYNGGHYSKDFIDSFADAFSTCVDSVVISSSISEIDITSQNAIYKFDDFNDTCYEVPYRPAYRILEDSAKRNPDKIAVIASSQKITYLQLDNMSNYLANLLIKYGILKQEVIEIIVDRTKEIYIAQNGIMKAGCAFLCLSPEYPTERISFVTNDAKAKAVVTTHEVYNRRKDIFESIKLPVFFADDISIDIKAESPEISVGPDDLCYLIYTSGSTGKPKGVKLCNRGFINFVDANPKNVQVTKLAENGSVSTAVTAFTFDASLHEAYYALENGMTICVASEDEIHNPAKYTKLCLDNKVTTIIGTPSLVLNMLDYQPFAEVVKGLSSISTGGESMPLSMAEKIKSYNPNINLINVYGPTEATVISTYKVIDDLNHITIGKPIANTKIYIIDEFNHILPMGALGEMVVVGDGVGKGYINRDDLTAKVFIKINGEPAYKTGDLALINHAREIEYHGRIDNQVKLRGLRVELGEIESAINSCDSVKSSIVMVYGDEKNKYLVAYFTATREITKEEITSQISKTLTEYMIPKVIIQLKEMPLTANGKIDKRALPEPEFVQEKKEYSPPTNDIEKSLCSVFEDVLGVEKVGIDDDFFELGGTSLTATKVAMYALSHDISIVYGDIFKYPTVKGLAQLVNIGENITVSKQNETDFADINKALSGNVWTIGNDPGLNSLGNILLTGATGFLGMHILHHFLKNETGDVYCLLRKGSAPSMEVRLLGMYIYYFDESIESLINTRIHFIDGDITDKDLILSLNYIQFDTLINCAACVKHFANDDVLNQVNVVGVENLTELCLKNNKKLIHISTVSVAGEGIDGTPAPEKLLHENELYFNQILENDYILSKFNSERVVLEAVSKGLDAKIMRAGNLMPRRSDGEFQINYSTNGFMRKLHGYYAVGCVPYSALSSEFEFSPIDETAGAMLTLAKSNKEYNVFHANNTHHVFLADIIRTMNDVGLHVDVVDEEEFVARLKKALEDTDTNQAVSGLIAYLNRDVNTNRYMIGYDNAFSRSILNRMGYYWHITDDNYLRTALKQLNDIGFFDFNN